MIDIKRITFFIGALPQGGAERVITILTDRLVEEGYDVTLILLRDKPIFYSINKKVKIVVIEKNTGTNNIITNFFWLRRFFRSNRGLCISFLAQYNILAIAASIAINNVLLVADRNDPRHWPKNKCLRLLRNLSYRFADGVILQTEYNKQYFCKTVQKKSVVIPNPVDLGEMRGIAIGNEHRHDVINVARLMPQKNQRMLIHAFKSVVAIHPEYRLLIYGDGPLKDDLEEYIKTNNLDKYVFLKGTTNEIYNRIAESEIFVLTSFFEGMPNALIEAMCLGVACISTRVSGAQELIDDSVNGLLIDINNEDQIVEKICMLIDNEQFRMSIASEAEKLNDKLNVTRILKMWMVYISGFTCE